MGFNSVPGNDDATMRRNDMRQRSQSFSGITFAIVATLLLAMGLVFSPAIGSAGEPLDDGDMKANSSETATLMITAIWIDGNNAQGTRQPKLSATVTKTVSGGGESTTTVTLLDSRAYTYTAEVPLEDDEGRPISYSVSLDLEEFPAKDDRDYPEAYYSSEMDVTPDGLLYTVRFTLHPSSGMMSPSVVSQAPTANEIVYDGTAHQLVQKGTADGGQIMYALGENGTSAPSTSSFSDTIPTGTNAGSYFVWYYVKGDVIHYDTQPQCVTAGITKPSLTITVNEQTYEYDGDPHGESDAAYDDPEEIATKVKVEGLAGADKFTSLVLDGAETEPGLYEGRIEVTGFSINDDPDADDNYDVTLVPGNLTILDSTKEYTIKFVDEDGTEL